MPRSTGRWRWCCWTRTPTPGTSTTGERYFHGTPFRRAVEEGLLLPERSLLAGMRGSLYSERGDLDSDARRSGSS